MPNDYKIDFNPSEYLKTYYSQTRLSEDERVNATQLLHFLKTSGKTWQSVLEIGCGPTIHHAIPLANFVEEIHLSDYLTSNLDEVRLWLASSKDAHNWNFYIHDILELEGLASNPEAVSMRSELLRKKVKSLQVVDLHQSSPLAVHTQFDLVTMFYTAECASRSRDEWLSIMQRVSELVAPGGTLFQVSMRNCSHYSVGNTSLQATPIDENDLRNFINLSNFERTTATITPVPIPAWASHGFNSIIISIAEKPKLL